MMVGTREEELIKAVEPPAELPEVVNDLDVGDEEVLIQDRYHQIYFNLVTSVEPLKSGWGGLVPTSLH